MSDEPSKDNPVTNVPKGVLAVVVLAGVMIGSIYYPWPSGEPLDVPGFVMLWLRELIALGVAVIAIIFCGVALLWQSIRQLFIHKGKKS